MGEWTNTLAWWERHWEWATSPWGLSDEHPLYAARSGAGWEYRHVYRERSTR